MFHWGILSTAKIGREHVIPAIAASENSIVSAIASRDIAKAQPIAERFNAKAFGNYEDLLADPQIDGVYIPLHTSAHIEWSLKAVQAGKHVLCEKPISTHASQIDKLITARDAAGLVVSEAFMVTYHPQWAKVRELIATGAIGKLQQVDGAFSYFLMDENNMRNQAELGGGGLLDIGVYPIVTTRFACEQEPTRLRATVDYDPKFGTDRYARVEAEFDGFAMNFYISTQLAPRQQMVFHGDEGYIQLDTPFNTRVFGEARIHLQGHGRAHTQAFNFPAVDQYQLQIEEFVRATQGEGEVFSLENSRANQRIIDACFEAGKTQTWIEI